MTGDLLGALALEHCLQLCALRPLFHFGKPCAHRLETFFKRRLLLRRDVVCHELFAEGIDLLLEAGALLGEHLVGGLFRRQRIGSVGFAMIGVAALELVALDKRSRQGCRAVDHGHSGLRRRGGEHLGLAGNRDGTGNERVEHCFFGPAVGNAE